MVFELMKKKNPFMKEAAIPAGPAGSRSGPAVKEPATKEAAARNLDGIMNTLQASEWELIKILGSGQATFASQIYRLVNISGGIFK